MRTSLSERRHSSELCELAFDSAAEFPHDELMRLVVPDIFMDDDPGAVSRFCAWHTPHYVSRLTQDADMAMELLGRVDELEREIERLKGRLGEEPV